SLTHHSLTHHSLTHHSLTHHSLTHHSLTHHSLTHLPPTALFAASTSRPLPLAMRRDLIVRQQRWQGREYWTVKDPLTLKYYRFEDEEFAILSMLDGEASIDVIRERFE